jgi:fibro-slime domain-containing protein
MRRMKKSLTFGSIFVLSLTLLMIAMPYILKIAVKSNASSVDPDMGSIKYYKADLFDYGSSKRSTNGNFLLGNDEVESDATLFLFDQDECNVKTKAYTGQTVPVPGEHNSWNAAYRYKVAKGLVNCLLDVEGNIVLAQDRIAVSDMKKVKLFDVTDTSTFKGTYSFPFENIGEGYVQFDSSKNHIQITGELNKNTGLLDMLRYDDKVSSIGFMPFNKLSTSVEPDEDGYYALSGDKNFYFGMKVEIPFVMPKGGKVSINDDEADDMMFSFSGDDDLWVFVDDELVLDLGGVHEQISGQINFASGIVTTVGNHFNDEIGKYNTEVTTEMVESTSIKNLAVGRHKLQIFYLERGGNVSKCKMTFRLQEDQTPDEVLVEDTFVGPNTKEDSVDDFLQRELEYYRHKK